MTTTSAAAPCPICASRNRRSVLVLPRLAVAKCDDCGHRVASHRTSDETSSSSAADYHEQYEGGAFTESIAATRRRQAAIIADVIEEQIGLDAAILDYGAGRGWFLDVCRERGFAHVAGADTSALAVTSLRDRGIPAALVPAELESLAAAFAPDVLTMLDVVEHLPAETLRETLAAILERFRASLRLIVVKVPSSRGFLYRVAETLARASYEEPLEQLYQVGTSPPHHHYFAFESLRRLMTSLRWEPLRRVDDLDFEPEYFADRVALHRRFQPKWGTISGLGVGFAARTLRMKDSIILFCSPASDASVE